MAFDHERFRNLAAGVQSSVLAVAVIIGGVWTFYTFDSLRAKSRAEAELVGLEQRIREQGVVSASLQATAFKIHGDSSRYISATATVRNNGNRNMTLYFDQWVFAFSKVDAFSSERPTFVPIGRSPAFYFNMEKNELESIPYVVLLSGEEYELHSVIKAPSRGLYFVEFEAELGKKEGSVSEAVVQKEQRVATTEQAEQGLRSGLWAIVRQRFLVVD